MVRQRKKRTEVWIDMETDREANRSVREARYRKIKDQKKVYPRSLWLLPAVISAMVQGLNWCEALLMNKAHENKHSAPAENDSPGADPVATIDAASISPE